MTKRNAKPPRGRKPKSSIGKHMAAHEKSKPAAKGKEGEPRTARCAVCGRNDVFTFVRRGEDVTRLTIHDDKMGVPCNGSRLPVESAAERVRHDADKPKSLEVKCPACGMIVGAYGTADLGPCYRAHNNSDGRPCRASMTPLVAAGPATLPDTTPPVKEVRPTHDDSLVILCKDGAWTLWLRVMDDDLVRVSRRYHTERLPPLYMTRAEARAYYNDRRSEGFKVHTPGKKV